MRVIPIDRSRPKQERKKPPYPTPDVLKEHFPKMLSIIFDQTQRAQESEEQYKKLKPQRGVLV